jgi:hypothetical protein
MGVLRNPTSSCSEVPSSSMSSISESSAGKGAPLRRSGRSCTRGAYQSRNVDGGVGTDRADGGCMVAVLGLWDVVGRERSRWELPACAPRSPARTSWRAGESRDMICDMSTSILLSSWVTCVWSTVLDLRSSAIVSASVATGGGGLLLVDGGRWRADTS